MKVKIAVIGLGYVGLPLACEFAKKYPTIGYDIDNDRIAFLKNGIDKTNEVESNLLSKVLLQDEEEINKSRTGFYPTNNIENLKDANFYIITVPTPTDKNKRPILTPLIEASRSIGNLISKGDFIIYESTVYPGVTEDVCVPVLEFHSGKILNKDFYVGYSPERINPGDKNRSIASILKVTSGSTKKAAKIIDDLYKSIIIAGTFLASSIKVAEASKVIENSQRDINIAFVNELAKIFNKLNLDTHEVLEAAGTKWNFLPFKPGLVGGHCIGVDPYYLAEKAKESGYYPEIILAGRRINDSMGKFVSSEIVKRMVKKKISVSDSKALILGFSFKENCPDFRNTRVIDIYNELTEYGLNVDIFDPIVNVLEVKKEMNINIISDIDKIKEKYSLIILAVSHDLFMKINFDLLRDKKSFVYDIKGFLDKKDIDARL